eukprot:gene2142-2461_t
MTGLTGWSLQSQDIQCGQGSQGTKATQGSGTKTGNIQNSPAQQIPATAAAGPFAVPGEVKRMRREAKGEGPEWKRLQGQLAGMVQENEGMGPAGAHPIARAGAALDSGLQTPVCSERGCHPHQGWLSQHEHGQHRKEQQQQHNSSHETELPQTQQEPCLASAVVPHSAVVSYVWSVIRHLVPAALLGSRHNRQVLRAAVSSLVRLRRHETVSLQQLMKGLRTSHMDWAKPVSAFLAQQRWLCCWAWWLLSRLVLPLLRNSFYVTESEPYRQAVFYYRKPVWRRLLDCGLAELTSTCFQQLPAPAAATLLCSRELGVSGLRLLPKRTGLRPIAKLGSSSIVRFKGARNTSAAPAPGSTRAAAASAGPAQQSTLSNQVKQHPGALLHRQHFKSGATAGVASGAANGAGVKHVQGDGRSRGNFRPLGTAAAVPAQAAARGRSARARGVPLSRGKRAGVAVAGLAAAGGRLDLHYKPVNFVLQPAYQVLRAEVAAQPELLGCSVFSLDEVCRILHPFLRRFKAAQAAAAAATAGDAGGAGRTAFPQAFIICADVRKAFDSVSIPQLLELVRPIMRHQQYQLIRYTSVSPMLGTVRVRYNTAAVPAAARNATTEAAGGAMAGACRSSRNTVFSDQVLVRAVSRQEVAQVLEQHLTGNLLRQGGSFFLQTTGDPTSDSLPTTQNLADVPETGTIEVCSQAPAAAQGVAATAGETGTAHSSGQQQQANVTGGAHQTASELGLQSAQPGAHRDGGLPASEPHEQFSWSSEVVVTTAAVPRTAAHQLGPEAAETTGLTSGSRSRHESGGGSGELQLYLQMDLNERHGRLQGFPQHNIYINPDKTQLNFSALVSDGRRLQPNVWKSKDGSCWVRWCGLMLHTVSLELMADYTRYSGQHISTALTLNRGRAGERPGRLLLSKVMSYMRPKMHALLLDTVINSPLTVRLNIYQAFLLAFMKLHWAVRCLLGDGHDPTLVLKAIQAAISYCVGLVRGRVGLARLRLSMDVRASISRCHIRWLGLKAAQRVLSRKQSNYTTVLKVLKQQLADPGYRHVWAQLAPVVDPDRSSVFDEILY